MVEQLKNYKQTHLLAHHSVLRTDTQEEIRLIEDLTYLDYATVDFVRPAHQLFHHFIKNKPLDAVLLESNLWHEQLRNLSQFVVKDNVENKEQTLLRDLGYKLLAEKKSRRCSPVGLLLYASEYGFFEDYLQTVCILPLPLASRKTNLQMMLERVKYLFKVGRRG